MREDIAGSLEQGAGSMNLALRSGGSTGWQEHGGQGAGDTSQAAGSPAQTSRVREAAVGSSFACTRYSPPVTSHSARRAGGGFTLIELLVVVVIISILAGLALGTLGYVNSKSAESRARSEVAALSAAIESYKIEVGSYPATNNLYRELTGQGTVNTSRVFFEPTPSMVTNNKFIDPWSVDYVYINSTNFFELYSKGGNTTNTNPALFIRN